jgi:transcriptional regulator of acetoin/glycerol metabolism
MKILHPSAKRQKRAEIETSWERCRALGLKPMKMPIALPCAQEDLLRLQEENKDLMRLTTDRFSSFQDILPKEQFCIMFHHVNGIVFGISGTDKFVQELARLGIGSGAKCGERDMGTTAPGICLFQKKSCWVMGKEHFLSGFESYCSAASPVFSDGVTLVGCLSLWVDAGSAICDSLHFLLNKMDDASRLIMLQLQLQRSSNGLKRVETALDTVREGILIVDANGFVQSANRPFLEILGSSKDHIKGRPVHNIFPYLDKESIKEKSLCSGIFATTTGDFEYDMDIIPVLNDEESAGAILRLCARRPILKLANHNDHTRAVTHDGLIAASHSSRRAIHIAKITAKSRSNILLQGETGTGKEVFARFIHRQSNRSDGPFVAINCAAIPVQLAESELFGYASGAFTGANPRGQKGKFELAHEGTLFLDEVNSLNLEIQKKLLRALESQEITPLGEHRAIKVNTRIVTASTADLRELVLSGAFLPELLYRINAITINIPPLRERKEDILYLAEHFLQKLQMDHEKSVLGFEPEAKVILELYDWPGNIRELRNALEYALALMGGQTICADDLPDQISTPSKRTSILGLRPMNRLGERQVIMNAIDLAKGNMTLTAQSLGISRSTLYRKIRSHGISV